MDGRIIIVSVRGWYIVSDGVTVIVIAKSTRLSECMINENKIGITVYSIHSRQLHRSLVQHTHGTGDCHHICHM